MAAYPAYGTPNWDDDLKAYLDGLPTTDGPFREALADELGNSSSPAGVVLTATLATEIDPLSDDLRAVRAGNNYVTARPVVTFITDDGDAVYTSIMGAIAAEKNIKISLAAVAGYVSGAVTPGGRTFLSLAQLKTIRAQGHDILSHGWAHLASYDVANTPAILDADWEQAKEWFQTNLPEAPEAAEVLVYPGGLSKTDAVKKGVARKHYRYGVTTPDGSAGPNRMPADNWAVMRIQGDTLTEAQIKAHIDTAVTNNGWLVIMTHDWVLDSDRAANMTKIRNVIDYCAGKAEILKWTDAEKVKGNAVALGEYTDVPNSTFIARAGIRMQGERGMWIPRLFGSTVAGAHTYVTRKGWYSVNNGMVTVKCAIRLDAGTAAVLNATGSAINIVTGGDLVLKINNGSNVTVALATADTPASVVTKINTALGATATASLASGVLRITSTATGPASSVTVVSGTGSVLADLFLSASQTAAGGGGVDSLMSGNLRIDGLPATVYPNALEGSGLVGSGVAVCGFNRFDLAAGYTTIIATANGTSIALTKNGNNVSAANLTQAAIVAGQVVTLTFTLTYLLAGDSFWT